VTPDAQLWTLDHARLADDRGQTIARIAPRSLLAHPPTPADQPPTPELRWSGSFAELDDPADHEPDDHAPWSDGGGGALFSRDPRTWSPRAWAALTAALATVPASPGLILRPHARHVVSDEMSIRRALDACPSLRILLDPTSMLESTMLEPRALDDHYRRFFELAAALPESRVIAVVFSGVRPPLAPDAPPVQTSAAAGLVPLARLTDLARAVPPAIPLVRPLVPPLVPLSAD
jgi:hypothetical protein